MPSLMCAADAKRAIAGMPKAACSTSATRSRISSPATETLIAQGYADPQAVFAQGDSAGGLLMGAIANLRPDLYAGIVAEVPFVDVITTMSDSSVPLTTLEYDEWGNPAVKREYDYMLSYSPYDNVARKNYPAMFVTAGFLR